MKKVIIEMENGDVMKGELYPETAPVTVARGYALPTDARGAYRTPRTGIVTTRRRRPPRPRTWDYD